MSVVLYHATPHWNLGSIHELGLLPEMARGERQRVYLHSHSRIEWALTHVARRHHCEIDDIRIVKVTVPRGWLKSLTWGLCVCERIIPAERISRDLTRQMREGVTT